MKILFVNIWSILIFISIPICIVLGGLILIVLYSTIIDFYFVTRFRKKYPSKRFLMINKNDTDYLSIYSQILENRIGLDAVVINEIDLEKEEYRLERKIYKSNLSRKNYLPTLIHIDKSINRIGLYYAFKDYLKGKRKKINKVLKNLDKMEN